MEKDEQRERLTKIAGLKSSEEKFLERKVLSSLPNDAKIAVFFGSGMEDILPLEDVKTVNFGYCMPFNLKTSAAGHKLKIDFGIFGGKKLMITRGRLHTYDGYSAWKATYLVRLAAVLGVEFFIFINAVGGVNPDFKEGDIMIVEDHIALDLPDPLNGLPGFTDMTKIYDFESIVQLLDIAKKNKVRAHTGVLRGVSTKPYETKAERKYIRLTGADAVGVSSVILEMKMMTYLAENLGFKCKGVGLSLIANEASDDQAASHTGVVQAGQNAGPALRLLLTKFIQTL